MTTPPTSEAKMGLPAPRPVFGLVSIGVAIIIIGVITASIVGPVVAVQYAAATTHSVGAVAGGIRPWAVYVVLPAVVIGVISAVVGLVRGEGRWWVHAIGVVLNVIAPIAAILTVRLLLLISF